ncbi:hypothetical protein B296_00027812 [Ensete ventricosum]|uniref:Uncharacterized protein n=1 Tax=Ensete ventricosum TaxID=4639 RepID=A0A426Z2C2_ENSVE|nr:hypothetical protein B296_00027812 [Ensete ventricosum]
MEALLLLLLCLPPSGISPDLEYLAKDRSPPTNCSSSTTYPSGSVVEGKHRSLLPPTSVPWATQPSVPTPPLWELIDNIATPSRGKPALQHKRCSLLLLSSPSICEDLLLYRFHVVASSFQLLS